MFSISSFLGMFSAMNFKYILNYKLNIIRTHYSHTTLQTASSPLKPKKPVGIFTPVFNKSDDIIKQLPSNLGYFNNLISNSSDLEFTKFISSILIVYLILCGSLYSFINISSSFDVLFVVLFIRKLDVLILSNYHPTFF